MLIRVILTQLLTAVCKNAIIDKSAFCANIDCDSTISSSVCGIRKDGDGYRLRSFESECDLLKFGCKVDDHEAYGLINIEYCDQSFTDENPHKGFNITDKVNIENEYFNHCNQTLPVCGIKKDGIGFKIAFFENQCDMIQHNSKTNAIYTKTLDYLCETIDTDEQFDREQGSILNKDNEERKQNYVFKNNQGNTDENKQKKNQNEIVKGKAIPENIIVINAPMHGNINETIDAFFAATHLTKIPVSEIPLEDQVVNETSRRMLLKSAGPIMVFKPWITIPKKILTDKWHTPTLASCYHRCPEKCPDTYAPVCGVPGIVAREPSLMFQNHCFMDKAQCKMYWENKSPTAQSSAYVESAFLFCLGDEITSLYRFLPLVRTLQHMGRLKKHGKFRYRLRNLRFFNNLLPRQPNIMG